MNDYRYGNEIIYEISTNKILNSKEIFEKIEELKEYDFGIRFSKLAVNTEITFGLIEKRIELNIYGVKGDKRYLLKDINGKYIDYIIANNVWHYLGGQFEEVVKCLKKLHIINSKNISFPQYINLIKEFINENIKYIDNVENDVKKITI